jgi:RNA polymerase sigma-70 factor (ECF subfamily)
MHAHTTHEQGETEAHLLEAVSQGDQAAFERIYHEYEKRVYQYVGTLLNNSSLAEDVVGETMMAVWRGAGTFSGTSRVSTWILGIARHKAMDALRKLVAQQREIDLEHAAEVADPRKQPCEELQRKQLEGVVGRALATLTQQHQEILRLVFYEELSYEDIGQMLSIPINTVKTRVYYAKEQLRKQLSHLQRTEAVS